MFARREALLSLTCGTFRGCAPRGRQFSREPGTLELHIGLDPEDDSASDLGWLVSKCERFLPMIAPAGLLERFGDLKVRILKLREGGREAVVLMTDCRVN